MQNSLTGDGALVDLDSDGNLWAPSAQLIYSPTPPTLPQLCPGPLYQPVGALDPWNNLSTVAYDDHILLVTQTRDAVGNTVVAESNYRVWARG